MSALDPLTVLIVEDGDEYLDTLGRYVPGPRYLQAKSGDAALHVLASEQVQLVYLDMCFDRSDPARLLGDLDEALRGASGNLRRAQERLARDQGLHILAALRAHGHGALPVLLAYDFGREPRRFEYLQRMHPSLSWVPDEVTADALREQLLRHARG